MADDSRRRSASGHQPPPPGALFAPFVPALTSSRGAIIVSHPEARLPNKSSRATPERKPEDTVLGPHKGGLLSKSQSTAPLERCPQGLPSRDSDHPWKGTCPKKQTPGTNVEQPTAAEHRSSAVTPAEIAIFIPNSHLPLLGCFAGKVGSETWNGLSGGKTASHQVRGTPMVCGLLCTHRPAGGSARTLADVHPRCREPGRNAGVGGTYPFPAAWGRRLDVSSDPARLVNCPHTSVRKPHRRVLVFLVGTSLSPWGWPACEMDHPAETASLLPGGSAR